MSNSEKTKCCVCGKILTMGKPAQRHMAAHVEAKQATMELILTPEGIFSHYIYRKAEQPETMSVSTPQS